jgi:general secretion pathway protein A
MRIFFMFVFAATHPGAVHTPFARQGAASIIVTTVPWTAMGCVPMFHPAACPVAESPGGVFWDSFGSFWHSPCCDAGVYLDYYGLTEPPFDITPNPRFLFHSAKHREALNHLLYGLRERKGFIQLTGEVGAGKTTLCRAMLEQLEARFATALILNPVMSSNELMKAIGIEFGLSVSGLDRLDTLGVINQFLLRQVEDNKESVLIIDEAQDLTDELLEQVRLLSNLETDNRKLLQIVLMGQPELRDRLNNPRLRQLRQRITVRYHLLPLTRFEVSQYVQHRIHVSGGNGVPFFTWPALWRLYHYAKGIPRLVNAICDKALLAGFVAQTERISFRLVNLAIRELEGNYSR